MVNTKLSAFFAALYLLQEGGANSSLVEVGVTTYKLFLKVELARSLPALISLSIQEKRLLMQNMDYGEA
jgi:hypothetical protein